MSRKRKIEAVGEHIASAAMGDFVSRTISAAVGKLDKHADAESQVERLDALVTKVRSAVEAAEGVHIRNWWLRRWLWKLREAACEGADAVRSFRRRAAEKAGRGDAPAAGPWWARLVRTAKSFFLRDGGSAVVIRCAVERLEEAASGLSDFLKLLDMEIRSVPQHPPPQLPGKPVRVRPDPNFVKRYPERASRYRGFIRYERGPTSETESPAASGSKEPDKVMEEGRITGVIRFAVGAGVIWFAFQVGSKMFRRRGAR